VTFPVRAGSANVLAGQILKELRDDPRIDDQAAPSVNVSKVIDAADPTAPVVELTVGAKVKPSDADAVKQRVLDHASALLAAA
jgi:small conductance mechanosensitive channel